MAKDKEISEIPVLPIGNRVLIELIVETETAGGLQLPVKEVKSGIVVAMGTCIFKELVSPDGKIHPELGSRGLRLRDKVFLPKGRKIGDEFEMGSKKYLLMPVDYIGGILPS